MSKHTPGPWSISLSPVANCHTVDVVGADRHYVATVSGYKEFPSTAADANLIAAAPELLEALIAVTSAYDGCSGVDDSIQLSPMLTLHGVKELIAKATTA